MSPAPSRTIAASCRPVNGNVPLAGETAPAGCLAPGSDAWTPATPPRAAGSVAAAPATPLDAFGAVGWAAGVTACPLDELTWADGVTVGPLGELGTAAWH
jgi:hypothetical protein